MYELGVRELTQTQTLVIEHNEADVAALLRILAAHCEASDCTLLSVSFANEDEGGYRERLVALTECPYPNA